MTGRAGLPNSDMPVLEAKPTRGHWARATIKQTLVTFHLTPLGQKRLLDGDRSGSVFDSQVILARQLVQHQRQPNPLSAEATRRFWEDERR